MRIFYIDIEKFKTRYDKNFLIQFTDMEFKTEKRFYQYSAGRYLVKSIAKNIYHIKDTEIITTSEGKPVFKNNSLNFSISHSKNIVIACFDKSPCGIDIEYAKPRNLLKLSEYFEKTFQNTQDFYKFWTLKEAVYKLQSPAKYEYFTKFQNDYYLTVVSADDLSGFQNPQCVEYC